jgi:predicted glycosyltransferase involved in capsule biosynthesis
MWQIKQTLPQNLKDNASMKGQIDFILVDFGSADGLKEWVLENFKQEIEEGYLKFFYTEELEHWHASVAKNTAHVLSESDVVVNLDCDNFTGKDGGKFVLDNMLEYGIQNVVIHQLSNDAWDGSFGRIALSRKNFVDIGGYDESFEPMAYQDNDLLIRAIIGGAKYLQLEDGRYNKTIRNDKNESIKYTSSRISWEEMELRNRLQSWRNMEEGKIVANEDKQSIGISKNIYRIR